MSVSLQFSSTIEGTSEDELDLINAHSKVTLNESNFIKERINNFDFSIRIKKNVTGCILEYLINFSHLKFWGS